MLILTPTYRNLQTVSKDSTHAAMFFKQNAELFQPNVNHPYVLTTTTRAPQCALSANL